MNFVRGALAGQVEYLSTPALGSLPLFRKASAWSSPTGKGSGRAERGSAPSQSPLFTETGNDGLVAPGLWMEAGGTEPATGTVPAAPVRPSSRRTSQTGNRQWQKRLLPGVSSRHSSLRSRVVPGPGATLRPARCHDVLGHFPLARRPASPSPHGGRNDSCGTAPVSHRTSLTSRLLREL